MFTTVSALIVMSVSQNPPAIPPDFDFWVGSWKVEGKSRNTAGKDEWTVTKGSNVIRKILKNQILEETFSMPGFEGKSWTTYHPKKKAWVQTWVDDTAGYLTFEGGKEGNTVVLHQLMPQNQPVRMKMVFSNITKSSFDWNWSRSDDSGKNWQVMWQLKYTRK